MKSFGCKPFHWYNIWPTDCLTSIVFWSKIIWQAQYLVNNIIWMAHCLAYTVIWLKTIWSIQYLADTLFNFYNFWSKTIRPTQYWLTTWCCWTLFGFCNFLVKNHLANSILGRWYALDNTLSYTIFLSEIIWPIQYLANRLFNVHSLLV